MPRVLSVARVSAMKSGLPQSMRRDFSAVISRPAAFSSAPDLTRSGMRPVRSPWRAGSSSRVVVTISFGRRSDGSERTSSRASAASSIFLTDSTRTMSFQAFQTAPERMIDAKGERPEPVARSQSVSPPGMRDGVSAPSASPSRSTSSPGLSAQMRGESAPPSTSVMKNSSTGLSGADAIE